MLKVILDLPPVELSPNKRVHWAKKAKKIKEYRQHAMEMAMASAFDTDMKEPFVTPVVQISYFNARNVKPDADNILAAMKSAFDGFTDAGIWKDDRFCFYFPVRRECDRTAPRVEITITEKLPKNYNEILENIMRDQC